VCVISRSAGCVQTTSGEHQEIGAHENPSAESMRQFVLHISPSKQLSWFRLPLLLCYRLGRLAEQVILVAFFCIEGFARRSRTFERDV
jgi:hypothetical protein